MGFSAPTHIAQIAIVVEDVERAKAWYRDRLGLVHLFDAPPGLSFLRCGSSRLMLSRPEPEAPAINSILYFAVIDIEGAHRAMDDASSSPKLPASSPMSPGATSGSQFAATARAI